MITPGEGAEGGKKLFFLSPVITGYFPTDSSVESAFGSSWWGIGVSLNMETLTGGVEAAGLRLAPYFGLYHGEKHDNDAWIIPIGIQGRWGLSEHGSLRSYAGIGVAGYAIKLDDRSAGIDTGWKSAFGGRVMLGVDITRWFNVEAAYNIVSDVKDYDLSGFSLQGKLKIYF
ncbi:MAG: hypothetical protein LBP21_10345 [Synergistaceae bacterium]|nr:hypothetical protein [Synergistaceae bacterium]